MKFFKLVSLRASDKDVPKNLQLRTIRQFRSKSSPKKIPHAILSASNPRGKATAPALPASFRACACARIANSTKNCSRVAPRLRFVSLSQHARQIKYADQIPASTVYRLRKAFLRTLPPAPSPNKRMPRYSAPPDKPGPAARGGPAFCKINTPTPRIIQLRVHHVQAPLISIRIFGIQARARDSQSFPCRTQSSYAGA